MNRSYILLAGVWVLLSPPQANAQSQRKTVVQSELRGPTAGYCGNSWCIPPDTCETCPEDCGDCVCTAPMVYDNGLWNGLSGASPTGGWTQAGLIDDFIIPDPDFGGTRFSCAEVVFGVQAGAPPPLTTWELRIYDLEDVDGQGGGDGTIAGLGDFNLAVPKCSLTYSVDDGSLVITEAWCEFGCVFWFHGIDKVCDLEPGVYGFPQHVPWR